MTAPARRLPMVAALALASFVVHNANHVLRGEAHDLLWVCNVAPLVLAIGAWLGRPRLVSVATLWLFYGTPVWVVDLATGASLLWTSVLPHVLCPVLGVAAVRVLGLPKWSWTRASGALVGLMLVTRLVTPPAANVNLVFAIWHGWEGVFPSHAVYVVFGLVTSAITFFVGEQLLRLFAPRLEC